MDNDEKDVTIHFLECNDEKQENFKDYQLHVNRKLMSLNIINNFITSKVGRNYRLYNFNGLEIMDNSDVERYKLKSEKNNVIFYSKNEHKFETKNILRVFHPIKKLGEGGFGSVYLAEQIYSGELYAIKYIKSTNAGDYSFLYKEIEALKLLYHKYIIRLINYCVLDDNKLVFILEYVSGGSLRDYLNKKKKLSEEETRNIFSQIIETIQYCHKKNIVHRDLKPENILFTNESKTTIKLIDFGLAGLSKYETTKGGSLRYMSPEVISGVNTEILPSIDVWSLGCLLYEMLTGKFLFDGSNRNEIKDKILGNNYIFPTDFSKEVVDILEAMLKQKDIERISIANILKHVWINGEKLSIREDDDKFIKPIKRKSSSLTMLEMVQYFPRERAIKRGFTTFAKDTTLPALVTKFHNDSSPVALIQELNSNVPNYLKPIGHDKNQKRNLSKLKNYINKYNQIKPVSADIQKISKSFNPCSNNTISISNKIVNAKETQIKMESRTLSSSKKSSPSKSTSKLTNRLFPASKAFW